MKREDHVDYFFVRDEHLAIHGRLEEWARWVRVRPHGWQVAPMFRQYRSKAFQWHSPEIRPMTNIPQALEIEKAVSLLPEKHRTAIRFAYVWCGSPVKLCRDLGVSKAGLLDLIHGARTMLKNRSA
jgi:DNA-directed RNA polymerase specialized sigma24 family protein